MVAFAISIELSASSGSMPPPLGNAPVATAVHRNIENDKIKVCLIKIPVPIKKHC
jgi:hypothetical protein